MTRLVFVAIVLLVGAATLSARQQTDCDTPLSEGDLRQLISAGVPPARMRQLIASCGIDFGQPDLAALENRLRQIGAPSMVIAALHPETRPGATWKSPIDQRLMTFVQAGRFAMGSPDAEPGREPDETLHDVTIDAGFWIDVSEVTNASFRQFVLSRPEWQKGAVRPEMADARYLKHWDGNNVPRGSENDPVVSISWHAARAYAAWAGKRLPTEAEWEYAARAGVVTAYWWGSMFDASKLRSIGGRRDDSGGTANAFGIADMTGGVWEWTASLYRPYPFAADGRDDPQTPGRRAIRGGATANGAPFLRLANRNTADPTTTSDTVGFRCVQ